MAVDPKRLAEIRDRHDRGIDDTLELLLDCLGNGINVLDHTSKGSDNWIQDLKRYQADHVALLAYIAELEARPTAILQLDATMTNEKFADLKQRFLEAQKDQPIYLVTYPEIDYPQELRDQHQSWLPQVEAMIDQHESLLPALTDPPTADPAD